MTPAIADTGSLIDGGSGTILLVAAGFVAAAAALAWLLCRAAAVGDRVEPGCDESAWADCIECGEPQRATEVYDHLAVEALHADLAAFERGER